MPSSIIEWETPEHTYVEKTADWYWAFGIIVATLAALAFIFDNAIFGVLIVVGGFALGLAASKRPRIIKCTINDRGIVIDNTLYYFISLNSFWVDTHHHTPKLVIKSLKPLMPYVIVPLLNTEPEEIRQILLNYIAEVEHPEPLSHKILERLGI